MAQLSKKKQSHYPMDIIPFKESNILIAIFKAKFIGFKQIIFAETKTFHWNLLIGEEISVESFGWHFKETMNFVNYNHPMRDQCIKYQWMADGNWP